METWNGWGSAQSENRTDENLHRFPNVALTRYNLKGGEMACMLGQVGKEYAILPHAAHHAPDSLRVRGMGIHVKADALSVFGRKSAGE